MIKRTLGILLVLAIVGIAVHDLWRYVSAEQRLQDATYELARWAAENADGMRREQAGVQLVAMATPMGVKVYQYDQTDSGIQIWTETSVPDTIVVGTIANLIEGRPVSESIGAPFTVRDYQEAGMR